MTTPRDSQLARMQGWPLGVNNRAPETEVPVQALREAVNVDLSDGGKPRRRTGYTLAVAGDSHSLFNAGDAMLGVVDGVLKSFNRNLTATVVRSGMTDDPVSYAQVADSIYWSNSRVIRRLTDEYVDAPLWTPFIGQPTLAAYASGGLHAGTYQVAITYLDADGRESGTDLAQTVLLTEGQGILLTNIPPNADANRVRIYVSQANSEVLYLAQTIAAGVTSYIVGVGQRGKALATQFMDALPPGQVVRAYAGRLHVAAGDTHWWSEPLRYGLTTADNYVRYSGRITMVEKVGEGPQSGMYVAAGKRTYWLDGPDPSKWVRPIAHHFGAVEGTAAQVPGTLLGLDVADNVPYWLDSNGVFCAGLPGGRVVRLTEKSYLADTNAQYGASLLRRVNGIVQMVTTARGGEESRAAFSDTMTAEVRRRGLTT